MTLAFHLTQILKAGTLTFGLDNSRLWAVLHILGYVAASLVTTSFMPVPPSPPTCDK